MRTKEVLDDLIALIFRMFSIVLDTDQIAIRLKDKTGAFPIYKWIGYEKDLIELIRKDDHASCGAKACLCCMLLRRDMEFIGKYCRASGAFISSDLPVDLVRIRNEFENLVGSCSCEEAGFRSVGLLPFFSANPGLDGLFHIADFRTGLFTEENTKKIEEIVRYFVQMVLKIEKLSRPVGAGFRVLVAEDDEEIGLLVRKILVRFGYECVHCPDGAQALDYLTTHRVDLLITDLMMPVMDGEALIREVRRRYDIYGPRIMVLSARPDLLPESFAADCRISAILAKPLENIFQLPETVERVRLEETA